MVEGGDASGFSERPRDLSDLVASMTRQKQRFAVGTVIETEGSTSARVGSKAIFDADGRVVAGWVGGGCAESTVAHAALECMAENSGQIVELDLNDEVLGTGMPCGGTMKVFVEPVLPRPNLWVLGHGRVAECLCEVGAMLGLDVSVHDPLADSSRFPKAFALISDDDGYEALSPASGDFVVVATQHKGDHQSMQRVLASDVGYVALIASHKRTRLVLDFLRRKGAGEEDLARVRAPAGLDIGAATPEEVALSILSEITAIRRKGSSTGVHPLTTHARDDSQPRTLEHEHRARRPA